MTRRQWLERLLAALAGTSLSGGWQGHGLALAPEDAAAPWDEASRRGSRAQAAFRKCRQLLEDVKKRKHADSNLYFFSGDTTWLVQDAAADVLPFVVVAAHFLEPSFLPALRDTLRDEMRLTNDAKGIPCSYDLKKNAIVEQPRSRIIFGASEYCKDGLAAIVEALGKGEWFDRMKQIMDGLHGEIGQTTDYGLGPTQTDEVNGNLLQVLVRLFGMTQEERYLRWAERIGDDFLLKRNWKPTVLSDHGCEIISGLAMLYGLTSTVDRKKAASYQAPVRGMLDYMIEKGTDADGLMFRTIGQAAGDPVRTDNWGYDYVAVLLYDMVTPHPPYRKAVEKVLRNLPKYKGFPWGGGRSSKFTYLDELADSVEGGLYLLNRVPSPEGADWVEAEMKTLLSMDFPVHKFGANSVRTSLQYAFMQTQGLYLREWRADVRLGAVRSRKALYVHLEAENDWSGKVCFDYPRHRELMGFAMDYPRINSFPEWFTAEKDRSYLLEQDPKTSRSVQGQQLRDGIPLVLKARQPVRLMIQPT